MRYFTKLSRILVAFALLIVVPLPAFAVSLVMQPVSGTRTVNVMLDTGDELINAVEGSIDTGSSIVSAVSFTGSVLPLWLERPSTDSLRFSGIVPGGYSGSFGPLFSITLGGTSQSATLTPKGVKAYLNDGKGTEASLVALPASVEFDTTTSTPANPDHGVPEFSEVRIARDPAVFDNAWFVTFNAQDAESGVARYEVAEREGDDAGHQDTLTWHLATVPYRLLDQSRSSTVFVRVTDGAGNDRVATLPPESSLATNPYAILGGLSLLLLLLASVIVFKRARIPKK